MKFYYYINNGKQEVPFSGLPKTTKSRLEVYKRYGKSFKLGYLHKEYTPNDIFAKPKDFRAISIIIGLMFGALLFVFEHNILSALTISCFCIIPNEIFKQKNKIADEFNEELDLTNLK